MQRLLIMVMTLFFISGGQANGEIYKYKDANGVWRFTDNPLDVPEKHETIGGSFQLAAGTDLTAHLKDKQKPASVIETAALGVVQVQASAGTGAGFFVSSTGYLITNKHVVRGDSKKHDAQQKAVEGYKESFEDAQWQIAREKQRVLEFELELDAVKEKIDRIDEKRYPEERNRKRRLEYEYERKKGQLAQYKRRLEEKGVWLDEQEDAFNDAVDDAPLVSTQSLIERAFTVVFADKSEATAHLVRLSDDHDLALLRVDGYKNIPFLSPARKTSAVLVDAPVFAVGSPLGIHNSISKGVVVGTSGEYVETDTEIYPGNSGGPLITPSGKVVGINTLKRISGRGFEGNGYAIKIDIAMKEFAGDM